LHSKIPFLPNLLNHLRLPAQKNPLVITSAGLEFSLYSLGEDVTENTVSIVTAQQYLDFCLFILCRGNLFAEWLTGYERLLWLRYSGFQASCHLSLFQRVPKANL
jgi:hypothetical protein